MLQKLSRVIGFIVIFGFATLSLGIYQLERDIMDSNIDPLIKQLLTYPSYFENILFDYRSGFVDSKNVQEKKIILAAIDDPSLKTFGRFPWPRETWTKLLKKFKEYGVKVVTFDVLFPEPERFLSGSSPDVQFANEIERFQKDGRGSIILPYSLSTVAKQDDHVSFKEIPGILYNNMLEVNQQGARNLHPKRVMSTTFPISKLIDASPSLAYIGIQEDRDGVFRRYPLVANVDSLNFPSLALMTYQSFSGDNPKMTISPSGEVVLKVATGNIFLNPEGELRVSWAGDESAFPNISLSEVLNPSNYEEVKKLLEGNIVFIGSTAFGAHDLRHSPVNPKLPGVFFHINVVQMLLDGRFYKPPNDSFLWSWIILIIGIFFILVISFLDNAIINATSVILFLTAIFWIDQVYFIPNGYVLTLFFTLISVLMAYIWDTTVSFYSTSRDKKFLRNAFGNYISSELIDEMYQTGQAPELGGRVDLMTAYFTDIQSFSSFSELLSPKQLVELLNEYLTEMTNILIDAHGTLDKYEGDAIIAFFGAPVKLEDHAIRACRVAIGMQRSLGQLREKWKAQGDRWPNIVCNMRMRIGINSGEILVGNMGSKDRMNYTMMGDSVNLAARLEACAKQYGIFTQVSQFTKELVGDNFEMRELDTMRVVGKKEPVTTYDLLGPKGETEEDLLKLKELFHQGLDHYKNRRWIEAIALFEESLVYEYKRYPEIKDKPNPSLVYIDRCKEFIKNPPAADWDGVYTLTEK